MPLVSSLSQPITVPVIVKLGNDQAINTAVNVLQSNLKEDAIVVEFDTVWYLLIIWRAYKYVIWVGHGSRQGVLIRGKIFSWDTLYSYLKGSPARDIVLACHSDVISNISKGRFIGFPGLVDAKIGALLASFYISGDLATLHSISQQIHLYASQRDRPIFLYMSTKEWINFIAFLAVTIIFLIIGMKLFANKAAKAGTEAAEEYIASSAGRTLISKLTAVFKKVISVGISFYRAISAVFGGAYAFAVTFGDIVVKTFTKYIKKLNWIEWGIFLAYVAFTIVTVLSSAGVILSYKIANALNVIWSAVTVLAIFIADFRDPDPDPTYTVLQAVSKIFP